MALVHPTKNKGDLGVAKACADLVEQGYLVLLPMTEHAPFDLVTYRDGRFARVQVKYRCARQGTVTVHFRAIWSIGRAFTCNRWTRALWMLCASIALTPMSAITSPRARTVGR